MASIILEPSSNPGALVAAIKRASQTNPLLLKPGTHLTSPGIGEAIQIPIGASGLRIGIAPGVPTTPSPSPAVIIKRPGSSIDATHPDDNYGLYFVPAAPTQEEIATAQWKPHTDDQGKPFEFHVVVRGAIDISGFTVDCNMGEQGLTVPKDNVTAEHSAMFAFAGKKYDAPAGPGGIRRYIYVGFARVSLKKMAFLKGGFADDVWFSRGYFQPNIDQVILQDITSRDRVNTRRATISFSGLAQNIQIKNADIYRLHLEETSSPWNELPRLAPVFKPSLWTLSNIKAAIISLSAKGHVFKIKGNQLTTTEHFGLYEAEGTITNSALRVRTNDRRLFQLNKMLFDNVTWYLPADELGEVRGLRPTAQPGEPCIIEFRNNTFVVDNAFSSGQLFDSEHSVPTETQNFVRVTCIGCKYPASFATPQFPDTHIARARERGTWTFETDDFGNRDLKQAVIKGPQTDIVVRFV